MAAVQECEELVDFEGKIELEKENRKKLEKLQEGNGTLNAGLQLK